MNQNSFSHTARITAFVIGLFIPSLNFCPTLTPPPIRQATSCRHLRINYRKDMRRKFQLAKAILDEDFNSFVELMYAHVDPKSDPVNPNFAVPRKNKEPAIPIFEVLKHNLSKNCESLDQIRERLFMLKLLLINGADPNTPNMKGLRPLDLANEAETALLEKYGAQKSR